MKLKDARHLSAATQEALRYRVGNAVESGMSKSEAARVFKVSRTAVDEPGVEESELDEMWSYVGKKTNPRSILFG